MKTLKLIKPGTPVKIVRVPGELLGKQGTVEGLANIFPEYAHYIVRLDDVSCNEYRAVTITEHCLEILPNALTNLAGAQHLLPKLSVDFERARFLYEQRGYVWSESNWEKAKMGWEMFQEFNIGSPPPDVK